MTQTKQKMTQTNEMKTATKNNNEKLGFNVGKVGAASGAMRLGA